VQRRSKRAREGISGGSPPHLRGRGDRENPRSRRKRRPFVLAPSSTSSCAVTRDACIVAEWDSPSRRAIDSRLRVPVTRSCRCSRCNRRTALCVHSREACCGAHDGVTPVLRFTAFARLRSRTTSDAEAGASFWNSSPGDSSFGDPISRNASACVRRASEEAALARVLSSH
jgi:hypothetical protein